LKKPLQSFIPYWRLAGYQSGGGAALTLHGADHPVYHSVLLWAVRRDESLLQTIAFSQSGVTPAGKYQAIV